MKRIIASLVCTSLVAPSFAVAAPAPTKTYSAQEMSSYEMLAGMMINQGVCLKKSGNFTVFDYEGVVTDPSLGNISCMEYLANFEKLFNSLEAEKARLQAEVDRETDKMFAKLKADAAKTKTPAPQAAAPSIPKITVPGYKPKMSESLLAFEIDRQSRRIPNKPTSEPCPTCDMGVKNSPAVILGPNGGALNLQSRLIDYDAIQRDRDSRPTPIACGEGLAKGIGLYVDGLKKMADGAVWAIQHPIQAHGKAVNMGTELMYSAGVLLADGNKTLNATNYLRYAAGNDVMAAIKDVYGTKSRDLSAQSDADKARIVCGAAAYIMGDAATGAALLKLFTTAKSAMEIQTGAREIFEQGIRRHEKETWAEVQRLEGVIAKAKAEGKAVDLQNFTINGEKIPVAPIGTATRITGFSSVALAEAAAHSKSPEPTRADALKALIKAKPNMAQKVARIAAIKNFMANTKNNSIPKFVAFSKGKAKYYTNFKGQGKVDPSKLRITFAPIQGNAANPVFAVNQAARKHLPKDFPNKPVALEQAVKGKTNLTMMKERIHPDLLEERLKEMGIKYKRNGDEFDIELKDCPLPNKLHVKT